MAISYNTSVVRDGLVLHLDAANPKSYPGTGSKTFVKYDGDMPASISSISGISQEYTHTELIEILLMPLWQ